MSPGSPPASYECGNGTKEMIWRLGGLREHLKHNGKNRQRRRVKAGSVAMRLLTADGKHPDMKGSRKSSQGIKRGVGIEK